MIPAPFSAGDIVHSNFSKTIYETLQLLPSNVRRELYQITLFAGGFRLQDLEAVVTEETSELLAGIVVVELLNPRQVIAGSPALDVR